MTSSNDTQNASSPKKSPSNKEKGTREDPTKSLSKTHQSNKHRRHYTYSIAVIIILITMSAAIYAAYRSIQLQQGTKQQVQRLLSQISTLKQQQINVSTQINTIVSTINETQKKLQHKVNVLDNNLQSALQQHLYQTKYWLLLKARYYLELAQINANWSNDLQVTAALLQQADAILVNFHDQKILNIRQTIAKEIAQLNTLPKLDIAGLLSQLDVALSNITKLPLKPTTAGVEKNTTTPTNTDTTSAWRERLKDSVGLLEKLVVIRHHDEDILPFPSEAYESMLRESVRLNLQEAQWAALQNNNAIYQFSLAEAIKNINRSFDAEATITIAFIKQLQAFQQIQLVTSKPTLEESLPLLNHLIESKESQTSTTSGENL